MDPTIGEHFGSLSDDRRDQGKRHRLRDICTIAIAAVVSGAEGWDDIELFGKTKEGFFSEHLALRHGIPSADTFRRVISTIKPEHFLSCFSSWVQAVMKKTAGEVIAIDGKSLRRSYDKADPKAMLHVVSAWANTNRLVLAQERVSDKSNEITAIPKLLDILELNGCIVTIDAMGCQHEIAGQIRTQEADYILALKGNQGLLHKDVREYFESMRDFEDVDYAETIDLGHARREVRRCWVSKDVSWLYQADKWQDLHSIIMVESERSTYEHTSCEQRYYISSLSADAATLLEAVRSHWGVENQVHWVLDVSFGEDNARIRRDHGGENFALLRRLAMNLLRQEQSSKRSLKAKRKQAGWDNEYLAKVLKI